MTTVRLKKSLHELIDAINDKELLNAYLRIMENGISQNKKVGIIGYDSKGQPITNEDLIEQVTAASERVKSGEYISQEDLEKESENW